jgi:hypothetical protein
MERPTRKALVMFTSNRQPLSPERASDDPGNESCHRDGWCSKPTAGTACLWHKRTCPKHCSTYPCALPPSSPFRVNPRTSPHAMIRIQSLPSVMGIALVIPSAAAAHCGNKQGALVAFIHGAVWYLTYRGTPSGECKIYRVCKRLAEVTRQCPAQDGQSS